MPPQRHGSPATRALNTRPPRNAASLALPRARPAPRPNVQTQGFNQSWFVERIAVRHLPTGRQTEFVLNDWVRGGQLNGRTYRPGVRQPNPLSRESSVASTSDLPQLPDPDEYATPPPQPAAGRGAAANGSASASGRVGGGGGGGIGSSRGPPPPQHLLHGGTPGVGRAGVGDESMSLDFDDEDGGSEVAEEEDGAAGGGDDGDGAAGGGGVDSLGDSDLPIFGLSGGGGAAKGGGGGAPSQLRHRPPGVVLDEDVEEVSTSTGLAWSTNPLAAGLDGGTAAASATAPAGAGSATRAGGGGVSASAAARAGSGGAASGLFMTAAALGLVDSDDDEGALGGYGEGGSEGSLSMPDEGDGGGGYVPSAMTAGRGR